MDVRFRYTRKAYSGRGRLQARDLMLEKMVANACLVCFKTLERKVRRNGELETMKKFRARKTCGWILKDGLYEKSDCLKKSILKEGNPNYRGIMPHCTECGRRMKTYPSSNTLAKHCRKCENKRRVGVRPKHLERYAFPKGVQSSSKPFQKGQKAWNKKDDFCSVEGCGGKYLAKGMCSKHYQRKN